VHHAESTQSLSARRLVGGFLMMLSPKVLIGFCGTLVIACGAFVVSRRWLIGSLVITGLLLALVVFARPSAHFGFNTSQDSDTMFDEVKRFPLASKESDSQFRPEAAEPGRFPDNATKLGEVPLELTPGEPGNGSPAELLGRRGLSRRLDAVRSRQAKGAWLTGTIEPAVETPTGAAAPRFRVRANAPQQSALQTPSAVLR
jgi:hypothetical protein